MPAVISDGPNGLTAVASFRKVDHRGLQRVLSLYSTISGPIRRVNRKVGTELKSEKSTNGGRWEDRRRGQRQWPRVWTRNLAGLCRVDEHVTVAANNPVSAEFRTLDRHLDAEKHLAVLPSTCRRKRFNRVVHAFADDSDKPIDQRDRQRNPFHYGRSVGCMCVSGSGGGIHDSFDCRAVCTHLHEENRDTEQCNDPARPTKSHRFVIYSGSREDSPTTFC
jgi:hypothetical protein